MDRVPTGCRPVDDLLGGGVETGSVTLVYGEGGSGKTNLCLQMARNVARDGHKVVYVDSEGVSLERLGQISGDEYEIILRNILFSEVHSMSEQERMIESSVRLVDSNTDVGLIVVDSMTMYYRLGSRDDEREVRNSLIRQSETLLRVARRNGIPVIITSQVFTDISRGTYESLGGHVMQHNAKTILRLDKMGPGKRRAVVRKHRSRPEGSSAAFAITGEGIV